MTREEKELVFKDICARLPYGVKCQFEVNTGVIVTDGESSPFYDYTLSAHHLGIFMRHNNLRIKPYLRPMSSMTEEEKDIYSYLQSEAFVGTSEKRFSVIIDWLNKNMFDHRGLIEKDAAIAVTEDNNPYED